MRNLLCLLAVCSLAAAGCSGGGEEPAKEKPNLRAYEWDNIPAPETVGKDSKQRELRLSDFKGKVVVVDFWATWCPPCRKLIPNEKELAAAYKDKPFAILGVSGDDYDDKLLDFEKANGISWPSIRDGRFGAIHQTWEVDAVPTLFLVDHKGSIRYRFKGGEAFEERAVKGAIDELLGKVPAR